MSSVDSGSGCACCTTSSVATRAGDDLAPSVRGRARDSAAGSEVLDVSALDGSDGSDIVCTLDGGVNAIHGRVEEWQAVVSRATGRRSVAGGIAFNFDHDAKLGAELARLAAAEFACCSFFDFSLTVGTGGMTFAVSGPAEARDAFTAVFGTIEPALGDQ